MASSSAPAAAGRRTGRLAGAGGRTGLLAGAAALVLGACAGAPGTGDGGTAPTRLARVDGRVVDALGAGLPGITVQVGAKSAVTGPNGAFALSDVETPYDVGLVPPAPAEDQVRFLGLTTARPVLPLDPLGAPPSDPNGRFYAVTVTTTGGGADAAGGNRMTTLDILGTLTGAAPQIFTPDVAGTFPVPGFPLPRETSFDLLVYRGLWDERTGETTFDVGATARVPLAGATAQAALKLVPLASRPLTVKASGFLGHWSVQRDWLFAGRPPDTVGLPLVQSTAERRLQMPVFGAGGPAVSVSTGGSPAEGGASSVLLAVPDGATTLSVSLMPIPVLQGSGKSLSLAGGIAWRHPHDSVCALTLWVLRPSFQVTVVTTASQVSLATLGVPKTAAGAKAGVELLCLGGYPTLDAAVRDPRFALRYADRIPNARSQILPTQLTLGP